MIVNFGQSKSDYYSNTSFNGFNIKVYIAAAANNTVMSLANQDFNGQLPTLKGTLTRGGRNYDIFSDVLDVLNIASSLEDAQATVSMPVSMAGNFNAAGGYDLVAAAAAAKEILVITYKIKFFAPIVLAGNDQFTLVVNLPAGAVSANVTSASSYMDINADLVTGVSEKRIPYIYSVSVPANSGRYDVPNLGGVHRIVYVNVDQANALSASSCISNANVNGSNFARSLNYEDILGINARLYKYVTAIYERGQNWLLYMGKIVKGCSINLTLNTAVINGGKNWIVAHCFYDDVATAIRGVAHSASISANDDVIASATGSNKAGVAAQAFQAVQRSIDSGMAVSPAQITGLVSKVRVLGSNQS